MKIDVTECRYYNCGECFAEPQSDYCGEIHGYNKCDKYEDCYYKQLLRLKVKINECVNPYLDDICAECKYFENGNDCYECDYEYHRHEVIEGNTKHNLAKEILQIIEE